MLPIHQVLVYPIPTDTPDGMATESIEQLTNAIPLSSEMLPWFAGYYLPTPDAAINAYSSPLLVEVVSGLPPATMISADIDPLLSQGIAYAELLTAQGVPITQTIYDRRTHEFFGMGTVVEGR